MHIQILQWIVSKSRRIFNSIAFYPALIALVFLSLAILMVYIDYSETGKQIKASWDLLRLRDASTARSIISAITAGIISLTVFSFSMVMIVLNQAASQMSNRILDKLIGNRFQQIVLGFYIGTIVYSLFLLSTIRDIDSGNYVPSLSTYLLIFLSVTDIFLFIYFLHYITQSVKYDIIVKRIHDQTQKAMKHTCRLDVEPEIQNHVEGYTILAASSGIFSNYNTKGLIMELIKKDATISFLYPLGRYILEGAPLAILSIADEDIDKEWLDDLLLHIMITKEQFIEDDFNYGLRQLMEVAVKALSPGINDPGTAAASLHALGDLLAYRLKHFPNNAFYDKNGYLRITTEEPSVEEIFDHMFMPIWDYGKDDRMIQYEMKNVMTQLQTIAQHPSINKLLVIVHHKMVESKT